jgi:cytochrome c553
MRIPQRMFVLLVIVLPAWLVPQSSFATQEAQDRSASQTPVLASVLDACTQCHGADGVGTSPEIPNLAGQKAHYLASQLTAFKSGTRKHELMNAIAAALSNETIVALGEYWSTFPSVTHANRPPSGSTKQEGSPMSFPQRFPEAFVEYRRDEDAASGAVSIYYANLPAVTAARSARPLPGGSTVIVAFHGAKRSREGHVQYGKDGRLLIEPASSYSGMQAQKGWGQKVPALLRNGDWRYALFDSGGNPLKAPNDAKCLACHLPKAADDYVFTMEALRLQQ